MASLLLQYRAAAINDASAMVAVHYAAVHQISDCRYPPALLAAWSPTPSADRSAWLAGLIVRPTTIAYVAESDPGEIAGFCMVVGDLKQLKALYVHPQWARRGVGQKLLDRTEGACIAAGLERLELNASFNAEAFYRAAGYRRLGPTEQPLSDGWAMAAIKMAKQL